MLGAAPVTVTVNGITDEDTTELLRNITTFIQPQRQPGMNTTKVYMYHTRKDCIG